MGNSMKALFLMSLVITSLAQAGASTIASDTWEGGFVPAPFIKPHGVVVLDSGLILTVANGQPGEVIASLTPKKLAQIKQAIENFSGGTLIDLDAGKMVCPGGSTRTVELTKANGQKIEIGKTVNCHQYLLSGGTGKAALLQDTLAGLERLTYVK